MVRSGNGDNAEQRQRMKEMEAKLKEENKMRDREKRDLEEREKLKEEEKQRVIEESQRLKEEERQKVLQEAARKAMELKESETHVTESDDLEDDSVNSLLANLSDAGKVTKVDSSPVDPEAEAADRNLMTAVKHKSWLETRAMEALISGGINIVVPQEVQDLETIFGPGAAQHQLAIEYQGNVNEETGNLDHSQTESDGMEDSDNSDSDTSEGRKTSTPTRGKKRHKKPGLDSSGSLSPVSFDGDTDQLESRDKKLKFDGGVEGVVGKNSQGVVELQQQEVRGEQPGEQQLGDQKHGEQEPGDQSQGDTSVAGKEDRMDSEVTVGEVLSGAPPESSCPGGSGGGV